MQLLSTVFNAVTAALPLFLFTGALFLAVRLRFFPFLHPLRVLRGIFSRDEGEAADAPSPFRAASVALAGTIGVGNIAGVSLSLAIGGAGTLFWMWVCGCASMILKYAEVTLSHAHRERDTEGACRGGTPYTLRALGFPRLGAIFALLCLFYSFTVGGMVQANAIADCFCDAFSLSPLLCGILLLAITLPVAFGGGKRVSAVTVRLVPLMCLVYIAGTVAVIAANAQNLPAALSRVFCEALTPAAAGGGALGLLCSRALREGVARALMSNEGGCGTATLAHAESGAADPARQGLFGILEVGVDTLFLCTLTALAILSAFPALPEGVGGIALIARALETVFGSLGRPFLALTLFFFAYATILSALFYSEKCLAFFGLGAPVCRKAAVLFCFLLPIGASLGMAAIFSTCDFLLAAMALFNIPLLLFRSGRILSLTKKSGLLK